MSKAKSKLTVLVSSTVYGIEELLDRIFTLLTSYGYEVWMSHKGTVPVRSDRTAFANCLAAVENVTFSWVSLHRSTAAARTQRSRMTYRLRTKRCGGPSS